MRRLAAVAVLVAALAPAASTEAPPRESASGVLVSAGAKLSSTPPDVRPLACPADMIEIEGEYCPVVEEICIRQVDPSHPEHDRCAEFAPSSGRCVGRPGHYHFCIDRYEWPNRLGTKPDVAMDWNEAREECGKVGKRLCEDGEWTLACEGEERLPFPYGYVRNAGACNIDKPYIFPNEEKWKTAAGRAEEIARLDQRDPSGFRESCVSPYGVHDMTGNVDEWVVNEAGKTTEKPYVSGLKGGYWGPVRDRCRPMTTDHNQSYTGYQAGFRCCEDVPLTPPPNATPAGPTGS